MFHVTMYMRMCLSGKKLSNCDSPPKSHLPSSGSEWRRRLQVRRGVRTEVLDLPVSKREEEGRLWMEPVLMGEKLRAIDEEPSTAS